MFTSREASQVLDGYERASRSMCLVTGCVAVGAQGLALDHGQRCVDE